MPAPESALENQKSKIDNAPLGVVIRGSLSEGLQMKLAEGCSVEEVRAGRFVVAQGERNRFFSMITNVSLSATNEQFLLNPPPEDGTGFLRRVLAGTSTFGIVELRPMLMVPSDSGAEYSEESLLPVKTIPSHFSPVYEASAADVDRIFGSEGDARFFRIGAPLDMDETPVCLNLERFVERSNGIFGKSGTGKTFLTRLCLCGIIKQKAAVNLVFDMHSEYGWAGTVEAKDRAQVRGLKQFFGDQVLVYSLDPASSARRGVRIEHPIRIPYSQVDIDDVVLLGGELNLNPTALETGYLLTRDLGDNWLSSFLRMDADALKEYSESSRANPMSLVAFQRKLFRLQKDCAGFLDEHVAPEDDAVTSILGALHSGKHVVIEFGQYSKPVQYMLVANILTRRIHHDWVRKTEQAMGSASGRPRPLVITIEEAHKFLSPALAGQTIFGTIAREMRKYNCTLLVVDQRPSGIDDEVLSQIGTKLVCLLDDDRDMDAVLSGTPNAGGLRSVLASLETRQQALILGHAVPMPVVVRTRTYDDEEFRQAMGCETAESRHTRLQKDRNRDF